MAAGSPKGSDLKKKEKWWKRAGWGLKMKVLSFWYPNLGNDLPSFLLDTTAHTDRAWYNVKDIVQGCDLQQVGLMGGCVPQHVYEPKVAGYSLAFSLQPCNYQCLFFFLNCLFSTSLIFYKQYSVLILFFTDHKQNFLISSLFHFKKTTWYFSTI